MRHPSSKDMRRPFLIMSPVPLILSACAAVAPAASTGASAAAPSPTAEPTPTASPATGVPIGEPLETLWESSGPEFSEVWAPAVAPDGRIWVSAPYVDAFWVFDHDGTFLESWGTPGDGDGELNLNRAGNEGPFGAIAFRTDGGFYVAEAGNHRVQEFAADRSYVRQWGQFGTGDGQFVTPSGIALDDEGNVYVRDDDRQITQKFTPEGRYVAAFCADTLSPLGGVDGPGNVYCLDGTELTRVNPEGETTLTVNLSNVASFALGVVVDDRGHVFVGSVGERTGGLPENLVELDSDGTILHVWPSGGEGLALDPAGDRIYVSHWEWGAVRAYALPAD